MRRVVIDTETTGLEYAGYDRVIEIACVEMIGTKLTPNYWHSRLNPKVKITPGAQKVHGIKDEDLEHEPEFLEVVEDLIDFIANDEIVGHNYLAFDRHFINKEMKLVGKPDLDNPVVDTLLIARAQRRHGKLGVGGSLDALCKAFGIVNTRNGGHHGALIDADLCAKVYAHLMQTQGTSTLEFAPTDAAPVEVEYQVTPVVKATEEELNIHAVMCAALKVTSWQPLPRSAK